MLRHGEGLGTVQRHHGAAGGRKRNPIRQAARTAEQRRRNRLVKRDPGLLKYVRRNLLLLSYFNGGSSVDITEIEIDDANEEHLTGHAISIAEIQQVLSGAPDIRRNRKNQAATHVALGHTKGGRLVVIPLIDKSNGRVRPISTWEAGK